MDTVPLHFARQIVLALIALAGLAGCLHRPPLTGDLQGDLYWQGLVQLRGDVVLAEGAVLRIAPGTRIQFLPTSPAEDRYTEHPYFPGSELIVRGRLLAEGTAHQPIIFEFFDPDARPGSWGGINIEDSTQAVFNYCAFRQADSAIHARSSWVSIENSRFIDNLVGIRFHDTDILIENNLLQHNGAAIRFHFGAPVICNNEIRDNSKGIFITSAPYGYRIENNSLIDNRPYQISLGEGVTEPVEMGNNFWGDEDPTSLESHLYDGRTDDWLGRVNYLPMRTAPANGAGVSWGQ